MTAEIDEILDFLFVKKTSSRQEISEAIHVQPENCNMILNFLAEYNFIEISNSEVALSRKMHHFIYSTLQIGQHESLRPETEKIWTISK